MNSQSKMPNAPPPPVPLLSSDECVYYRDRLRAARYAALADAEGFGEICFAIEALGLRLLSKQKNMGGYFASILPLADCSQTLFQLPRRFPALFTGYSALYDAVNKARNDVMHSGSYARHATTAGIELCIGLEESLMATLRPERFTVADYMVRSLVTVEPWQPVAHVRQLMLMHSFSFIPVCIDNQWKLVSETAIAKYLHGQESKDKLLAAATGSVADRTLTLVEAKSVRSSDRVSEILRDAKVISGPMIWLVTEPVEGAADRLIGVLTPFELM